MSEDVLNIWIGKFESEAKFHAFMEEKYSEDEDTPLSEFATSQRKNWYDHDWLEYYFNQTNQDQLLNHIPNKYHYAVQSLIKEKQIADCNAIILFAEEWRSPVSKVVQPELWHLGQFDKAFLKRSRAAYVANSTSTSFWKDLPKDSAEMKRLEGDAEADTASKIKLGIMALCGIGMEKDQKLQKLLFAKSNASPLMIHEGLLAIAELGYPEAWLELYTSSEDEGQELATDDERRRYIETAVRLGSDDAKSKLASMLMYGWMSKLYEEDYDRAEALLLSISEYTSSSQLHQVYCLYNMRNEDTKAFLWKKRGVDTYGDGWSADTVAQSYKLGEGVEQDKTECAKYLYLSLCQEEPGNASESQLKLVAELSDDELSEGRQLAKAWIETVGLAVAAARGGLAHFSGEVHDPFQTRVGSSASKKLDRRTD